MLVIMLVTRRQQNNKTRYVLVCFAARNAPLGSCESWEVGFGEAAVKKNQLNSTQLNCCDSTTVHLVLAYTQHTLRTHLQAQASTAP